MEYLQPPCDQNGYNAVGNHRRRRDDQPYLCSSKQSCDLYYMYAVCGTRMCTENGKVSKHTVVIPCLNTNVNVESGLIHGPTSANLEGKYHRVNFVIPSQMWRNRDLLCTHSHSHTWNLSFSVWWACADLRQDYRKFTLHTRNWRQLRNVAGGYASRRNEPNVVMGRLYINSPTITAFKRLISFEMKASQQDHGDKPLLDRVDTFSNQVRI